MSVAVSLSESSSSSADTVTVCAVFQFEVVNVSVAEDGSSVRSVFAWPAMVTVTLAVGCEVSFTV